MSWLFTGMGENMYADATAPVSVPWRIGHANCLLV